MTVSILQSNYIPWKGYFDLIARSDVFVIYDEVQYTKNDWRNRNKIKTSNGPQWLTIPVKQSSLDQKIYETEVLKTNWYKKHINALQTNYGKAPYFKEFMETLKPIYERGETNLSTINKHLIEVICEILNIDTEIIDSRDLNLQGGRQERLEDACRKLKADRYLSGNAAKSYLDEQRFEAIGINVDWMDYKGYKTYNQLYPPFVHEVTILDLIFNEGEKAREFLNY
ncbi:WbqC family protein [Pseudotenacibaculum sp. MALMAid0570]|uniref:WbqC family protein n=1 Tax=Pseudotenacibaculum sp. MALMAid0570 TaxID=3143938 RepID=UPI0032E05166